MSTVKINALTRNIRNALVMNIKRERPDLAAHFSEHALAEIAKNEIAQCSRFADSLDFLTDMCITTMENQLKTTHGTKRSYCRIALKAIANILLR